MKSWGETMNSMQRLRMGLLLTNIKLDTLTKDASNSNYKNQKRDNKGRWTKSGKGELKSIGKAEKPSEGITKQEYSGLMHKVMEDMTREQRAEPFITKYYGDALYFLEKKEEGAYNILYRVFIK